MYFIPDYKLFYCKLTWTVDKTQASRWNWYPPHQPVCGVEEEVIKVFISLTQLQERFKGLCLRPQVSLGCGVSQQYLYCFPAERCVKRKRCKNNKKNTKITKLLKKFFMSRPRQACEPCLKRPPTSSAKVMIMNEYPKKIKTNCEGWMKIEAMVWMVAMKMMMDWNKMMKMVNGNKQHWIDVLYQNVPLGLSTSNKEEIINQIMHSYRPHLLGVAEPRHSELETLDVPGYSLIKGMAVGIENPRLNVFVKDGVVFEILPMRTEIPAVKLKIAQTTLIFTYREWAKDGDQGTNNFDGAGGQNERWAGFIKEWAKVRGKCTLLGDCNFDYWKVETQHQRNCTKIRDMVLEKMIPKGYVPCLYCIM